MSRYILKRELPTYNVGDEFFTDDIGSLWLDQSIDGEPNTSRDMAYHFSIIEKFPNILTDWFEEIKEPLIKDQKIIKAVRAWLAIQEQPIVRVSISYFKDNDGFFDYRLYGYIEKFRIFNENQMAIWFEFRSLEEIKFDMSRDYTIAELCGEEEE